MRWTKLAATLIIAGTCSSYLSAEAQSSRFGNMPGRTPSTSSTTLSGYADLKTYERNLLQKIDKGVRDGKISAKEQEYLKSLQDFITSTERRFARGGMDFWEKKSMWQLYSQLERDIDQAIDDDNATDRQAERESRRMFSSQSRGRLDNIQQQIDESAKSGQLRHRDLARVRSSLDSLNQRNRNWGGRGFTFRDHQTLDQEIDQLERQVQELIASNNTRSEVPQYDDQLSRIWTNIQSGIDSGQLTADESDFLMNEYEKLKEIQKRWSDSRGRMTSWESALLGKQTRQLETALTYRLNNDQREQRKWRNWAKDGKTPTSWKDINEWRQFQKWQASQTGANFNTTKQQDPIWFPSRQGGYYDGTNTIQGVIPGNELYKYGGTMSTGEPVPTNANIGINAFGHILNSILNR